MGGFEDIENLTNDELEFRILRLKIENFELQKLIKLKEREIVIVKMLNTIKSEIRAQRMVCDSVKTDYMATDFRTDNV
jgi:hypothetical protein